MGEAFGFASVGVGAGFGVEPPWVLWRLRSLVSNHGLVGLLVSVERCLELCWGYVVAVPV